eukprot:Nk52_evm42s2209 gene=Nk52_evmTU42s2209
MAEKRICPAFSQGCPYHDSLSSAHSDLRAKCPAFKDGCPHRDSSLEEALAVLLEEDWEKLKEHAQKCPAFAGSKCPFADLSEEQKGQIKSKCPTFHAGCPFKSSKEELEEAKRKCPHFANH